MTALPSLADEPWLKVPSLQKVMNVIADAGGEARVAGGAVRNALLNEPVTEVDIASTLPPEAVTRICTAAGMSVHPTGIDHGTVTVVSDRQPYEVTTLRHDVETFGRRPSLSLPSLGEPHGGGAYFPAARSVQPFTEPARQAVLSMPWEAMVHGKKPPDPVPTR